MPDLWTKEKEIEFFQDSAKFATPEQLFYLGDDSRYYAYGLKHIEAERLHCKAEMP